VDCLDYVPDADLLPEELTLGELILRIKDIHSFQNSAPAIINRYVHPTNNKESSTTHPNRQSSSSNSRPARDFRTRSDTQCICGRWGHSVENCQQTEIHFLIAKYLQKDSNLASASQISECWRLAKEQYSCSTCSTVRAIPAKMPQDMTGRTDYEIMETLYNEDDALSGFL
jgi:hypothetical protein